jgi:hypothetical protein
MVFNPLAPTTPVPLCLNMTAPGTNISSTLTGGVCDRPFISRPGQSPGRDFILYLRAGKTIQATYRPFGTAIDNDAYLEVFDVTNAAAPVLLTSDNDSGGGTRGTDAMITVPASTNGRFIMIRTARVGGGGTSTFTLTITP